MMEQLMRVCKHLQDRGFLALLVGGAVRDMVQGIEPKDMDIEVYGASPTQLVEVLEEVADEGKVNAVGKSFGVLKIRVGGIDFDVSVPRRENKTGSGHKGFIMEFDTTITPEEAAMRRDFTFNAMAYNPLTGELLDFFGGKDDLFNGMLRHTSAAFAEDPLRVLRGMQFAGRFVLDVADSTVKTMILMLWEWEFDTLPVERIWVEWEKWALKSIRPSCGLEVLRKSGWVMHFPQLHDLIHTKQDPIWHPEGSVWNHTLQAVDAAVEYCENTGIVGHERLVIVLGALCHDMGKPGRTTINEKGRIVSPGHNDPENARKFLESIGCPEHIKEAVIPLVAEHMRHLFVEPSLKAARRLSLALRPATIQQWAAVVWADHNGRKPLPGGMPERAERLLDFAKDCDILASTPKPVWMGRHLIERGWKPGVEMGEALRRLFEAQVDECLEEVEKELGL